MKRLRYDSRRGKPALHPLGSLVLHCLGVGLFVGVLLLLFSSCSTLDERDECCEEVLLLYRYVPTTRDEYPEHIKEIRHYLFDARGILLKELTQTAPHSQRIKLQGLPVGKYTVLTLANRSTHFSDFPNLQEGKSTLSQLILTARYPIYREAEDGDPLYWNIREIEARKGERHTYYCDLSNIHCHLLVRVVWKDVFPPSGEGYHMELDYLPSSYQLYRPVRNGLYTLRLPSAVAQKDQGSTAGQAWHEFPQNRGAEGRIVSAQVPLFNNELRFRFRSLRYTDEQIPTLRIYHQGKLYRKELDLTRFFQDQGLKPDATAVQDYKIVVEISKYVIKIYLWTGGRIVDWQDGGSLQVEV